MKTVVAGMFSMFYSAFFSKSQRNTTVTCFCDVNIAQSTNVMRAEELYLQSSLNYDLHMVLCFPCLWGLTYVLSDQRVNCVMLAVCYCFLNIVWDKRHHHVQIQTYKLGGWSFFVYLFLGQGTPVLIKIIFKARYRAFFKSNFYIMCELLIILESCYHVSTWGT